jgi:zinc transport system substrate-binding protein
MRVVASFYPLAEASQRIGGPDVVVRNLTPSGAEPHDLELTSAQIDELIDADVVVYLGRGFQPGLEDALTKTHAERFDGMAGQDLRKSDEAEGPSADPHVWLDPHRWSDIVARIGDVFAKADTSHASAYKRRAREYSSRIAEVDAAFRAGLASCRSKTIVTNHAAFGYLSARYGLRQEAISGLTPEAEPDPARLAELADLVERDHVSTIYTETLVSPKVAQTLARETGVGTATLDPLEGLTKEDIDAGKDYASVMRRNLEILRTGLGCR